MVWERGLWERGLGHDGRVVRRSMAGLLTALVAALAGCGSSPGAPTTGPSASSAAMPDSAFEPTTSALAAIDVRVLHSQPEIAGREDLSTDEGWNVEYVLRNTSDAPLAAATSVGQWAFGAPPGRGTAPGDHAAPTTWSSAFAYGIGEGTIRLTQQVFPEDPFTRDGTTHDEYGVPVAVLLPGATTSRIINIGTQPIGRLDGLVGGRTPGVPVDHALPSRVTHVQVWVHVAPATSARVAGTGSPAPSAALAGSNTASTSASTSAPTSATASGSAASPNAPLLFVRPDATGLQLACSARVPLPEPLISWIAAASASPSA